MKTFFAFLLFLLGAAAIGAYFSFFIVKQTEQAIVLEFGKPKRVIKEPGLYWKIPVAQTVNYFDKRLLDLDTRPQEVIASGQKRLVVDAFTRYRIVKPLEFLQRIRDTRLVGSRLGPVLDSSVRSVLGSATFVEIVRDKREELMRKITEDVNKKADDFGIEVVDVRIKRADLPEANSQAIYRRMQTERQQEASKIRAEGEEQSRRVKANADREVTVIKANATRDSEIIRGEGDAERNKIFNDAFGRDADFFSFYRSMQAYEKGLKSSDTRLVISPDSDFFKYFSNPSGSATR